MRTRTAILWWLGWHPLATAGIGVLVGVVVGNVLVTWAVRAARLGGGVSHYVGALLRPIVGDGAGYLVALAFIPILGAIVSGLLIGVVLWVSGVSVVNRDADTVREHLFERIDTTNDSGTRYALTRGSGTSPLVQSPVRYDVTRCHLDERTARIERYRVRMDSRRIDRVGERQFAYDEIRSVGYEGAAVRVETADRSYSLPAAEEPADLVRSLADRAPWGSRQCEHRRDIGMFTRAPARARSTSRAHIGPNGGGRATAESLRLAS